MTTSHARTDARNDRRARRSGFSLVEVMVALTLLALGLSTMVVMSANVAVKARANMYSGLRNAVLAQQLDRMQAIPFDKLPTSDSSHTYTAGNFSYRLDVDVTPVANSPMSTFVVTVTPTNATSLARSVTLVRGKRPGCTLNTTNAC